MFLGIAWYQRLKANHAILLNMAWQFEFGNYWGRPIYIYIYIYLVEIDKDETCEILLISMIRWALDLQSGDKFTRSLPIIRHKCVILVYEIICSCDIWSRFWSINFPTRQEMPQTEMAFFLKHIISFLPAIRWFYLRIWNISFSEAAWSKLALGWLLCQKRHARYKGYFDSFSGNLLMLPQNTRHGHPQLKWDW